MKNVVRFGGIASAVCVATITQMPAFGQATSAAETNWAKMTQCAAIGDDKARHECTDDTLRAAGFLSEETKAAAKRKAFGLQKPASEVASAPPAPAKAVAADPVSAASAAPPKKQNEVLEVTLAKVEQGGDGKLVLTTLDGAV